MASKRYNNWLLDESAAWVSDGLVSVEQAEQLRARYPVASGMSWGLFLLSSIGAIIFGLGIILFFAYNWGDLHKFAKLALIISAVLLAHLVGLYVCLRNNNNRNLVEGFHVLGTMMFGAGIWLVAQIYHMDEHFPTAFALWGVGALALAWALPSIIQGLIATALLLSWGVSEALYFDGGHLLSFVVLVFGVLTLAWVMKSRVLLFFALIASLVLGHFNLGQLVDVKIYFYLWFSVATLHIFFARLARYSAFPNSADVLRTIGVALYGLLLFVTTFEENTERLIKSLPESEDFTFAIALMGVALVGWISLTVHMVKRGVTIIKLVELILVLIAIVLVSLLLVGVFNNHSALSVLLINAVLLAHCVLRIIIGTEGLNWRHVAIGYSALTVLVFLRFNDLFQSLLMRSLVFLVLGAVLFFIGHIYTKRAGQKSVRRSVSESTLNSVVGVQSNA